MIETEILGKMIERLQDKGWIKGVIWEEVFVPYDYDSLTGCFLGGLKSIKGRACLRGTAELCSAFTLFAYELSVVADRLAAVIGELFPGRADGKVHWEAVECFNDHEDTTFEDVMLVLKHAIGKMESGLHDRAGSAG